MTMENLESKEKYNIAILRRVGSCKLIREEWMDRGKKKTESCSDHKSQKAESN